MSTPLTDAINALTTYANETTGASDTDLSSAVATLVAGYGGGGGVESGTFTPESNTQTFTCSVSTTYSHLLVIVLGKISEITIYERTLAMGYATNDGYQCLVDTNGDNLLAFTRSGDWRAYATFTSTTITAAFLGNGMKCYFPSGNSYKWFAW